jgi:hypothetical protein
MIREQRLRITTKRRKALLAAGYWPIPTDGKIPPLAGWSQLHATDKMINGWVDDFPNALNTSVLTFNAPAIDIDVLDSEVADEIEQLATRMLGSNDIVRTGRPPKRALFFRTDQPFKKLSTGVFIDADDTEHKVEVLCDGQQIVVSGIHPDTEKPYTWRNGRLGANVPRSELPLLTQDKAAEFIEAAKQCMTDHGWRCAKSKSARTALSIHGQMASHGRPFPSRPP